MKIWLTTFGTLLLVPSIYAAASPTVQTLDLANDKNTLNFVLDKKTELKIKIVNMLPSKRGSYVININSERNIPTAFNSPFAKKELNNDAKSLFNDLLVDSTGPCKKLASDIATILALTEEKSLPIKLANLHSAAVKTQNQNCIDIYENTLKQTQWEDKLIIERNRKYTVAVTFSDKEIASMTISGPSKTWLTHVGFAFVDNKNNSFYSRQIQGPSEGEAATYELSAATDRKNYNYTAMAMFTYPFWDIGKNEDWQMGFTAGLGTDANNIAVGAGLSLIIHKNFLITAGVVATEFDVLKGQHSVGDNLGSTAIDGASLVEQTYKFSPAVTFSYRFGSDE